MVTDAKKVKTSLLNVIVGANVAEGKVQALPQDSDGRGVWIILRDHYEGTDSYATMDVTKAENIIENLANTGEKPLHMH